LKRLVSAASFRQSAHESLSREAMIRQQFYEQLNEPISDQHQKHFRRYFQGDISTKTFSIAEFARLFQMTPILSTYTGP